MTLGPRPAPSEISFAPECFQTTGARTVWVVPATKAGGSYPKRFEREEEARAYARKINGSVHRETEPVTRRVKWF